MQRTLKVISSKLFPVWKPKSVSGDGFLGDTQPSALPQNATTRGEPFYCRSLQNHYCRQQCSHTKTKSQLRMFHTKSEYKNDLRAQSSWKCPSHFLLCICDRWAAHLLYRGNSKIRTLRESSGMLNKTHNRGSSLVFLFLLPLEAKAAFYLWNNVLGQT